MSGCRGSEKEKGKRENREENLKGRKKLFSDSWAKEMEEREGGEEREESSGRRKQNYGRRGRQQLEERASSALANSISGMR